ncbi:ABC transporter substrate-binding protein [Actinoalloteichus hymeniacidonis]|uniref:ABC transporter, substrate-binding protein, aliphatic sulfonates family n=1 Tax=Actinoalloteichus hymeniacidonis TaxID=340345 RepID=A0AAC9HV22_9PSEU|nr:ABC transporter substrate-binding protein [Actinoalloteichus hymeniacidonis]AOS65075.1 ABC transporter, substrate-binding protein, aliphatic sulfonates family [Actinoalloteichus hymeniacidonis]MBB5906846.1 NitT/TauT family transport system substrate-binding protein [Actinoalloteichus hymeniacidonis]
MNPASRRGPQRAMAAALVVPIALILSGCSRVERDSTDQTAEVADQGPAEVVNLGYFPNITHWSALIGVADGRFEEALGDTRLETHTFNAGPDAVNGLLGDSLDIQFIGSNPTLSAYEQSDGTHTRLIAGVTSGGAQLVVRPEIASVDDLGGSTIATPQLANTQDVAAKKWLFDNDIPQGTGDDEVEVSNVDNAETLALFRDGQLDGGWLPEPWSSRLVIEADAEVLVDERDEWPDGRFPTTVIIARTEFLQAHPETVEAILRAHVETVLWARENPEVAKASANEELERLTGNPLDDEVLDRAWENIEPTWDPDAGGFPQLAENSVDAGLTDEAPELSAFSDLRPLNRVLTDLGEEPVDDAGLDDES